MNKQGDELWSDSVSMLYHQKQYLEPKTSTLEFIKLIEASAKTSSRILGVEPEPQQEISRGRFLIRRFGELIVTQI